MGLSSEECDSVAIVTSMFWYSSWLLCGT